MQLCSLAVENTLCLANLVHFGSALSLAVTPHLLVPNRRFCFFKLFFVEVRELCDMLSRYPQQLHPFASGQVRKDHVYLH